MALELRSAPLAGLNFTNATGNGANGWKALSYLQLSNAFDQGMTLNASSFASINTDDPDLSAFKARGGKLIQYHGLNDTVIFPQGSINYYKRVLAQMGGLTTVQSFYKFYLVPGMGHGPLNGTSNPNADSPLPAATQMYKALSDWVENGVAPDRIELQSQLSTGTAKALPICPYPKKATCTSGDPLVSASYTCS